MLFHLFLEVFKARLSFEQDVSYVIFGLKYHLSVCIDAEHRTGVSLWEDEGFTGKEAWQRCQRAIESRLPVVHVTEDVAQLVKTHRGVAVGNVF